MELVDRPFGGALRRPDGVPLDAPLARFELLPGGRLGMASRNGPDLETRRPLKLANPDDVVAGGARVDRVVLEQRERALGVFRPQVEIVGEAREESHLRDRQDDVDESRAGDDRPGGYEKERGEQDQEGNLKHTSPLWWAGRE